MLAKSCESLQFFRIGDELRVIAKDRDGNVTVGTIHTLDDGFRAAIVCPDANEPIF